MSTSVVLGAGATHCGKRSHNEDAFFVDNDLGLYIVADGVGGQDAGEIASKIVCQVLPERIRAGVAMADAVQEAHLPAQELQTVRYRTRCADSAAGSHFCYRH